MGHLRIVAVLLATVAVSMMVACGGGSSEPSKATQYPSGVSDDIAKQLQYDARVQSFDVDGENLVVNVNDAWIQQPQGMQERSLGGWYSVWHTDHKGKVEVKSGGETVATWSEEGFRPATKSKGESASES